MLRVFFAGPIRRLGDLGWRLGKLASKSELRLGQTQAHMVEEAPHVPPHLWYLICEAVVGPSRFLKTGGLAFVHYY